MQQHPKSQLQDKLEKLMQGHEYLKTQLIACEGAIQVVQELLAEAEEEVVAE